MWRCFEKYKTQPKYTPLIPPSVPPGAGSPWWKSGVLILISVKITKSSLPIQFKVLKVEKEANVLPQRQSSVSMNLERPGGSSVQLLNICFQPLCSPQSLARSAWTGSDRFLKGDLHILIQCAFSCANQSTEVYFQYSREGLSWSPSTCFYRRTAYLWLLRWRLGIVRCKQCLDWDGVGHQVETSSLPCSQSPFLSVSVAIWGQWCWWHDPCMTASSLLGFSAMRPRSRAEGLHEVMWKPSAGLSDTHLYNRA